MADTTKISRREWLNYIERLSKINDKAADDVKRYVNANGGTANIDRDELINYAYGVVTKYGEASASLSAEMYDAVANLEGRNVKPAVPADTPTYSEVAKTMNGILKQSLNEEMLGGGAGRLVKRTGVDTVMNNALRDGAQWAWIPSGDTCAFCIALASRGWQKASKKALKNGHAEHIHANCDCTYAIRFDDNLEVEGYDPKEYQKMYYGAEGRTPEEKINSMRRMFYAENKDIVGDESSKAEELLNFSFAKPSQAIIDFEEHARGLKNERAIITTPEGDVWATSQGGKRSVVIDTPNEAGYIFSHNHPIPANFSVEDVKGLEKSGYKQIRAVSPDKTYILEALNPVQIKDAEDRLFTGAMADAWEKLDEESAKKRRLMTEKASEIVDRDKRTKFAQREMQKILDWRMSEEDKWLKENASKYGYRYKAEKVN